MQPFIEREANILERCVMEFQGWFQDEFVDTIQPIPAVGELRRVREQLNRLKKQLDSIVAPETMCVQVEGELLPILKRAIMTIRRRRAVERDARAAETPHPEAIEVLNLPVAELDKFLTDSWFEETEPSRLPLLTEFVLLQYLEEKGIAKPKPARRHEEKFKVLQSPAIFLDDLRYFRAECELRGVPVTVGFLDIDNFKKFNTEHTEEAVDRDLLPKFASALEAHVYNHGYAYQQGGDEYLVLLPNMSEDWAVQFLFEFQGRLEHVEYRGIGEKPTVSIGVCHATLDCFLTDREIRQRANWAKDHAKHEGRNNIAGLRGLLYRKEDVFVYDKAEYVRVA